MSIKINKQIFEKNNLQNACSSTATGNYEISLTEGNHTMVCTFVGMITDTFKVVIESGKISTYNILLKQKNLELNTVVVTAGKYEQKLEEITVSMEIIKPKLIQEKNITRLDKALEQLPGVTILDEEPQIRGGSGFTFGVGSRVTTMVDGIPIMSGDVGRAEAGRKPAKAALAPQVDLPKAVPGRIPTLEEEGVTRRGGVDVRDAPAVHDQLGRRL